MQEGLVCAVRVDQSVCKCTSQDSKRSIASAQINCNHTTITEHGKASLHSQPFAILQFVEKNSSPSPLHHHNHLHHHLHLFTTTTTSIITFTSSPPQPPPSSPSLLHHHNHITLIRIRSNQPVQTGPFAKKNQKRIHACLKATKSKKATSALAR